MKVTKERLQISSKNDIVEIESGTLLFYDVLLATTEVFGKELFFLLSETYTFTIPQCKHKNGKRLDKIVARINFGKREIRLHKLEGNENSSSSFEEPTIIQSMGQIWDCELATVVINHSGIVGLLTKEFDTLDRNYVNDFAKTYLTEDDYKMVLEDKSNA